MTHCRQLPSPDDGFWPTSYTRTFSGKMILSNAHTHDVTNSISMSVRASPSCKSCTPNRGNNFMLGANKYRTS